MSTLQTHVLKYHADTIRDPDIRKKLEQQRIPTRNQLTLEDIASGKWKRDPVQVFDEETYQAFMLNWIVAANQPLTEPTNRWFLRMICTANPEVPQISGDMIKADIPQEMECLQGRIQGLLEDRVKVEKLFASDMGLWERKLMDKDWNYLEKV
ncbi:hypothetical protein M427DRAFT_36445 [Gonapodya prolifera JEL478]|uniref:Uncharacterized protein n=1 Tax=Gonapodya prolifera (strain JEL478) TaxID=1344416 RepID=A0A139A2I0_GONPJ|nr:hypothetical protein M427DRAFT_36445 [Gonapodya prolifera JEL478]|eukprot:KXS10987.1 hypothetical protein M427DRAFT_36445 [Gonapodya prolifera JEL478]